MPTFTRTSLYETLRVAGYFPDQRVELAAIGKRGAIAARWVTIDRRGLEGAARWLNGREGRSNLYLLANPLRLEAKRTRARRAEDAHCASRELLLLDVDPVKVRQRDLDRGKFPPDTPLDEVGTSPEKLAAAAEIATELRAFLEDRLGVRPPLVSSGRGRQLWLRIAGTHSDSVRRRLVQGLNARFSRELLADVDRSTHNVARLMRLPGSTNLRTGELAEVLDAGDGKLARAEDVVALADELLPEPEPGQRRTSAAPEGGARGEASPWTEAIRAACDVHRALDLLGLPPMPAKGNTCCPIHGGDSPNGFSVSPDGQLWKCWTGGCIPRAGQTHAAGDAIEMVARVRQVDRLEARRWLADQVGVERPAQEDVELPLADVYEAPREATSDEGVLQVVQTVLRGPRARAGVVAQDRRPTGSGKTYGAAREVAHAAAEKDGRYVWAAPNHNHARLDVLPAFVADELPVAIWDEDLDGEGTDGSPGVRAKLLEAGAKIVPVGERPSAFTATICKVPRFACPGPEVPGWTSESVAQAYVDAASRGWNPATTVCRACPKFMGQGDDFCSYWERRREVAKADVLIVPHHALKPGSGATTGRRALVIDEDPSGALVRKHRADRRGLAAFRCLLDAALEHLAADVERARELLEEGVGKAQVRPRSSPGHAQVTLWDEKAPEQRSGTVEVALGEAKARRKLEARTATFERADAEAQVVERAVIELDRLVARWEADREAKERVLDAYALDRPEGLDLEVLVEPSTLQAGCERVLRDMAKRGERLTDHEGRPVGAVRNLFPLLEALARAWRGGGRAVVHVGRGRGRQPLAAVLPVVEPLPDLPVLALDATGDPRLLELATKREVQLVEGDLSGKLTGVHLADVPCGRRRWKDEGRLERDLEVVCRHLRRVGAKRVGLVTFKAHVEAFAQALATRLGVEVRTLHYGAERGSNAFAGWADAMVLAGTPFVAPAELRLRASLEGASVEELLTAPGWQRRRLPGGGSAQVMIFPGDATASAYTALVRSALEQALGRALRGDYTPEKGVLVLAEPWPTRHRLRVSTREREALEGRGAELVQLLEDHVGRLDVAVVPQADPLELRRAAAQRGPTPAVLEQAVAAIHQQAGGGEGAGPLDLVTALVGGLVAAAGGAEVTGHRLGVDGRSVRRWVSGDRLPDLASLAHLLNSEVVTGGVTTTEGPLPPEVVTPPSGHTQQVVTPANPSEMHGGVTVYSEGPLSGKALCGADLRQEGVTTPSGHTPFRTRAHLILIYRVRSGKGCDHQWVVTPDSEGGHTPCAACVAALAVQKSDGVRALARRIGVSHPAVIAWRDGKREPDGYGLAELAEVAGVELPAEHQPAYRDVKPGEAPAGVGRVYAPARLPVETASEPAGAPEGDKSGPAADSAEKEAPVAPAESQKPTIETLRAWADPSTHPAWLCRAARRAKGLSSLATWVGSTRREGVVEIDQDLALQRVVGFLDLRQGAPVDVRRFLNELARLLSKRGAKLPKPPTKAQQRKASRQLRDTPLVKLAEKELDATRVRSPR